MPRDRPSDPSLQLRDRKVRALTNDQTWTAFRQVCLAQQVTAEQALGVLIARAIDQPYLVRP